MSQRALPSEFSSLRQQAGLSVPETAIRTGYGERTIYRWETGEKAPRKAVLDLLRTLQSSEAAHHTTHHAAHHGAASFTFIDLFAGIGGLRRGFETIGGRCIFTCEKDRYCHETYRANFPSDQHVMAGDVRDAIQDEVIPDHDVLLAGFPCQPFSIAGVSKKNALNRPHGFACEAQGTLFYDLAAIIRRHQPRVFVLENVKNLVSHDKGRTFRVIHDVLKNQLGYHLSWRVIDARSWVPQHRERIFIVGFREPHGFTLDDLPMPSSLAGPKLETILHKRRDRAEKAFTREDGLALEKYTLSEHLWNYLQEYAKKHRAKGNGFGFSCFGPDEVARTLSARYYKDGSEILIKQAGKPPRRLTPRECARLMGFDAPGQSPVRIPVSDTQAYRQFGNAVVVPVVEAVARHMEPFIRQALGGTRTSTNAVA